MTASSSVETFDYVVVGGGTAGLVLAARLTEDPKVRVLVLEAGEDLTADPRVNIPAMWTQLAGTSADWCFETTPQHALGGRKMGFAQGRLLGGSSALNSMNFVVSAKSNIDEWAKLGNSGWDWSTLSASLEKVYSLHGQRHDSGAENGNGSIKATIPDDDSKWSQVWSDTIAGVGFQGDNSPLSGTICGAVSYPDSIDPKSKTRSYACNAYLDPAKSRPNLTVWTSVLVEKILFSQSSDESSVPIATGVQYTLTIDGQVSPGLQVAAQAEVILSAGAVNSPRILELSGVGGATLLKLLDIPVIVDNPFVGENLQNHPVVPLSFETIAGEGLETIDGLNRQDPTALGAAMEAYGRQTGPFSKSNGNVMAHMPFPNINTESGRRDLESIMNNTFLSPDSGATKTTPIYDETLKSYVRSVLESNDQASAFYITVPGWASYTPDGSWEPIPSGSETYFSIPVLLAHPLSRGFVHIKRTGSDDESSALGLEVNPNYLAHPLDTEILARHVQFVESVLAGTATPLADTLNQSEGAKRSSALPPGPRAFAGEKGLELARQYVRSSAVGAFHYVGSCSMLPLESGGVVDSKLRVYGCRNLRVCDASVIPLATRANTMATVYALAERAADIIKSGI
ncbi:hypothetical protein N0V82_006914 [Gnomoniopsis sp. IMI 355080]|nr:hypothetical protein N0V82_006914 [Gnomoniopsis sp. IMI 355080]